MAILREMVAAEGSGMRGASRGCLGRDWRWMTCCPWLLLLDFYGLGCQTFCEVWAELSHLTKKTPQFYKFINPSSHSFYKHKLQLQLYDLEI
jgi:hypothetical protein